MAFRKSMGVIGAVHDSALSDIIFDAFDLKKVNRVSFYEFVASMSVMLRGSGDEKLDFAFRMIARSEPGAITKAGLFWG